MAEAKKGGFKAIGAKITRSFRDLKSEVQKIVWPSKKQVVNNTLIVIACVLVVGVFIWGFDAILSALVNLLINAKA